MRRNIRTSDKISDKIILMFYDNYSILIIKFYIIKFYKNKIKF